jgi:hypothetical protein
LGLRSASEFSVEATGEARGVGGVSIWEALLLAFVGVFVVAPAIAVGLHALFNPKFREWWRER